MNDTLGHTVGDQVLVEVARRLTGSVRPADTVCRWGGDEFVVLLEDPQEVGGQVLSRRVLEVMQAPVRVSGDRMIHVAASCGWVEARDGEDAVALLHRADMRMYETKRARKDPTSPAQHHELQQRLARAHARSRLLGDVNRSVLATAQLRLDRARATLRESER